MLAAVALAPWPRDLRDVAAAQAAPHTIFLVRHAERADGGASAATASKDPGLSAAGRQRATSLATLLKDAQIRAIFVTEFKRTQETAAPLAQALGLTPAIVAADDTPALIARLQKSAGNALVVGHSNSVPEVIEALGVAAKVTIADDQFDNLFVVSPGSPRQLLRLHFR